MLTDGERIRSFGGQKRLGESCIFILFASAI
jgi:hypothetical protein